MKTNKVIEAEGANVPNSASPPKLLKALAKAVLIDTPIIAVLAPQLVVPATIGAFTGYAIREYCNDYGNDYLDSSYTSHRLLKAGICGGVGNAVKYGITDSTTAIPTLLMGALNGFLYEGMSSSKFCSENSAICNVLGPTAVETLEGVIKSVLLINNLYADGINSLNIQELPNVVTPIFVSMKVGISITLLGEALLTPAFNYMGEYYGTNTTDNAHESNLSISSDYILDQECNFLICDNTCPLQDNSL